MAIPIDITMTVTQVLLYALHHYVRTYDSAISQPTTRANILQYMFGNIQYSPLWSSGQSFWLQIQRSRVRFPALPDFLSSSGSGTGSTQPREVN